MPSTATITAFYTFVANTRIKSAEMNSNLSAIRGHIIPVDPTASAAAPTRTWDLGSVEYSWRGVYSQYGIMYANTTGSVPASPTAGSVAVYVKNSDVYQKTSAGTEKQVGTDTIVGTRSSPSTITAAGGITFDILNGMRQTLFVTGDTTTGTDITANPQISAGTLGALVTIQSPNTATANPVILEHGNGLDQNGYYQLNPGGSITYWYDGATWIERGRSDR